MISEGSSYWDIYIYIYIYISAYIYISVCMKCAYKKYLIFHLPSKVYQISIFSEEQNNVLSAVTDNMLNNAQKQRKAEGHKSTISGILLEQHQWQTHSVTIHCIVVKHYWFDTCFFGEGGSASGFVNRELLKRRKLSWDEITKLTGIKREQ